MNLGKTIAMLAATVASAIIAALTSGIGIDSTEWVNIAIALVTALGVFAAPNVPGAPVTKAILAFLGAVLTLLVNLIAGGVDTAEWLQLLVAGLGAIGVYAAPYTFQGPATGNTMGSADPRAAI